MRIAILILFLMAAMQIGEAATLASIASDTFSQGEGAVLIRLMLLAVVGFLLAYIADAAGQGRIGGMIRVTTIFACISLMAGTAWRAVQAVAEVAGIR